MATDKDIVNYALMELGELSVDTFPNPNNRAAEIANTYFSSSKLETQELFYWNESIQRVTLSTSSYSASFEYNNAYEIPSNSIDIISVNENYIDSPSAYYAIEDGYILTDEQGGDINVKYVKEINSTDMSNRVARIFGMVLAKNICIPLTGNGNLKNSIIDRLEKLELPRARYKQGATQNIMKAHPKSKWLGARNNGFTHQAYYRTY